MISLRPPKDDNHIVKTIRTVVPFLDMTEGPWIAGGCGRQLFEGNSEIGESDIDLFFKNDTLYEWAVGYFKNLQGTNFGDWSVQTRQDSPIWTTFEVVFGDGLNTTHTYKFQLLKKRFFESIDEVFDDFDFTVCMFGTDGYDLVADPRAVEDMERRLLVLHKPPPKPKAARLAKYCSYGFTPAPGVAKAMFGIDTGRFFPELNLTVDEY